MIPSLADRLTDDLSPEETDNLRRSVRGRVDGNWDLRGPLSVSFAWRHGAWRQWFTSHRVEVGAHQVLNRNGEGCGPGYVKMYRVIYHLGPIKVVLG